MKKTRILMTGSSGFLGRATLELLAKDPNYEILELGRKTPCRENHIYSDLAKETLSSLESKIDMEFDVIIHLAALVEFPKDFNPELFQVNTIATSLLADIASQRNIRFIFASTATTIGARETYIDFNSEMEPDTSYALSKWLAERYLIAILEYPLILRFAGIFGFNGPPHLILNKSITEALVKRKVPAIYGPGMAKRNYIYVKDAAKAIKYGIENNIKGVHFIAGSEVLSIREIVEKICEIYIPGSSPVRLSGSEAKDQTVEAPEYFPKTSSFEEALKDIRKNYAKNRCFK